MYLMAGERKFRGRRLLILFTRLGIRARLSPSDLGRNVYAPMDFAIVVGWKAIIKAIFSGWVTSPVSCECCLAQTL